MVDSISNAPSNNLSLTTETLSEAASTQLALHRTQFAAQKERAWSRYAAQGAAANEAQLKIYQSQSEQSAIDAKHSKRAHHIAKVAPTIRHSGDSQLNKAEKKLASAVLFGEGSPEANLKQIKKTIDKLIAQHPGNVDGWAKALIQEAVENNWNLKQLIGASAADYKSAVTYLASIGITRPVITAPSSPLLPDTAPEQQMGPLTPEVYYGIAANTLFGPGDPRISVKALGKQITEIANKHPGNVDAAARELIDDSVQQGFNLKQIAATGLVSYSDAARYLASIGITPPKQRVV